MKNNKWELTEFLSSAMSLNQVFDLSVHCFQATFKSHLQLVYIYIPSIDNKTKQCNMIKYSLQMTECS